MEKRRERIVIVREREFQSGVEQNKVQTKHNKVHPTQINVQTARTTSDESTLNERELLAVTDSTDDSGYNAELYKGLRPLFFSLRFTGLFFKRTKKGGKMVMGKWAAVCGIICLCMFANAARSLLVFRKGEAFNEVLFFKVQFCIWSLENLGKSCVAITAAYRQDLLPRFFKVWKDVCRDKGPDKFVKVVMKHAIFMSWSFSLVNVAGITLAMFLVPNLEEIFLKGTLPGAAEAENSFIYKSVMIVVVYLASSIGTSSVSLLIVLSVALTREFLALYKEFSTQISKDGDFSGNLEEYRQRHQGLCCLVEVLDDIFAVLVAAVLISNIPMCCVIVYNLIYASANFSNLVLNLFWLLFLLVHMAVVSGTCMYVNIGAHAPLGPLYNIKAECFKDKSLELTLFLNRLTGYDVGLSALKLFVINRPAILTVIGMLITYFVLLVQFKSPTGQTCNCSINGTGTTWNGSVVIT